MFHKLRMTLFGVLLLSALVLSMNMTVTTAGTAFASSLSSQNTRLQPGQQGGDWDYRYWWRIGYSDGYSDGFQTCGLERGNRYYFSPNSAHPAYVDGYTAGHVAVCGR